MPLPAVALVLAGAIALTSLVPPLHRRRWHAWWPLPVMALGTMIGAGDLAALAGFRQTLLSVSDLLLGVWASGVVAAVGMVEIAVGRRGYADGRAFVAPCLLVAGGIAVFAQATKAESLPGPLLSGLLLVLAGIGLAAARLWPTDTARWQRSWAVTLVLAAAPALVPSRLGPAPFALAENEVTMLVATWEKVGMQVVSLDSVVSRWPTTIVRVERYRVDGTDVRVYLIAHQTTAEARVHQLWPQVEAPTPSAGAPHVHYGLHILVVCVTDDPQFARRLDALVHQAQDSTRQPAIPPKGAAVARNAI